MCGHILVLDDHVNEQLRETGFILHVKRAVTTNVLGDKRLTQPSLLCPDHTLFVLITESQPQHS